MILKFSSVRNSINACKIVSKALSPNSATSNISVTIKLHFSGGSETKKNLIESCVHAYQTSKKKRLPSLFYGCTLYFI